MRSRSSGLVERGDIDALTRYVNDLVVAEQWEELASLRESCRAALERGKQLWGVAAYIEYRLCLEAPGYWAALMLETGTGRFASGPLPEVAACRHSWSELAPHLHPTPQAGMAAHERVLRGEDLRTDPVAAALPEVLDLPLRLEPWEPRYVLADYHTDSIEAPPPRLPPLRPRDAAGTRPTGPDQVSSVAQAHRRPETDEVSAALEDSGRYMDRGVEWTGGGCVRGRERPRGCCRPWGAPHPRGRTVVW